MINIIKYTEVEWKRKRRLMALKNSGHVRLQITTAELANKVFTKHHFHVILRSENTLG